MTKGYRLLLLGKVLDPYFTLWRNCHFSMRDYMLVLLFWSWSSCMHACSYLVLSTPLSLNMWTYLLSSAFAWGQARSKLGGVDTSILHHAFMLIFIALWAVITLHGTILMPFLSYFARFTWRGRMPAAGILAWKWSKVEIPILRNSKRRKNQRGIFSRFIKNTGPKKR